ncbi:hypothetical protein HMPREF9445_01546 [Bacteroides clarus YIT 12056]|uniref:Uncharacterized protein n=1 Tax=Bacteroides clarus YIT 12056 TaxID=762984 RepID=A0ABN0CPA0_9BACE|nr:hypothetical protein HMPREF9445_01546 [Bacteroides clarus YIT 12056]
MAGAVPCRGTSSFTLWYERYHALVRGVSCVGTDGTALWYEQCHALKQVI